MSAGTHTAMSQCPLALISSMSNICWHPSPQCLMPAGTHPPALLVTKPRDAFSLPCPCCPRAPIPSMSNACWHPSACVACHQTKGRLCPALSLLSAGTHPLNVHWHPSPQCLMPAGTHPPALLVTKPRDAFAWPCHCEVPAAQNRAVLEPTQGMFSGEGG